MTPEELMRDGRYLPPFLRDFHAQKDLFKRIDEIVYNKKKHDAGKLDHIYSDKLPDWMTAHLYVVDFFLWYMAKCGYTLQRTRHAKGNFVDIGADVADHRNRRLDAIGREIGLTRAAPSQPETEGGAE